MPLTCSFIHVSQHVVIAKLAARRMVLHMENKGLWSPSPDRPSSPATPVSPFNRPGSAGGKAANGIQRSNGAASRHASWSGAVMTRSPVVAASGHGSIDDATITTSAPTSHADPSGDTDVSEQAELVSGRAAPAVDGAGAGAAVHDDEDDDDEDGDGDGSDGVPVDGTSMTASAEPEGDTVSRPAAATAPLEQPYGAHSVLPWSQSPAAATASASISVDTPVAVAVAGDTLNQEVDDDEMVDFDADVKRIRTRCVSMRVRICVALATLINASTVSLMLYRQSVLVLRCGCCPWSAAVVAECLVGDTPAAASSVSSSRYASVVCKQVVSRVMMVMLIDVSDV